MRAESNVAVRAGIFVLLGALFAGLPANSQVLTATNVVVRAMTSNLTGDSQKYEAPQIRILQGLHPDVVAMQEFKYNNSTPSDIRAFVDEAFGTNFAYFRETNSGYSIPNGIISRWPILSSGSWDDPKVNDRGFAWAQIDLPGTNNLYVVSCHLYRSGTATDRDVEANAIKTNIQTFFPVNAWVIVAGDFNTSSRAEAALTTFKSFLSDSPIPTDAFSGDPDTNLPRNHPYDYVLPSFSLTNTLTNVVFASHSFSAGLVFVSTNYTPLSDVAPVRYGDSTNGQHMAVLKDFRITYYVTNSGVAPVITNQPQSVTVNQSGNATFTVGAGGTAPFAYQWRLNLANIPGATAASYTRANVQPANMGSYSVVVSNSAGFAPSSNATLNLIVPRPVLTMPFAGVVQWEGLSNLSYSVQGRTNLNQTGWLTLGNAASVNNTLLFTNPPTGATQRFFRVVYP